MSRASGNNVVQYRAYHLIDLKKYVNRVFFFFDMFPPRKMSLYSDKMLFFDVFSYGFYTDLDDDELLGYFPLKLEEYNTSGDFAEMDIIFNRRVFCFIVFL